MLGLVRLISLTYPNKLALQDSPQRLVQDLPGESQEAPGEPWEGPGRALRGNMPLWEAILEPPFGPSKIGLEARTLDFVRDVSNESAWLISGVNSGGSQEGPGPALEKSFWSAF